MLRRLPKGTAFKITLHGTEGRRWDIYECVWMKNDCFRIISINGIRNHDPLMKLTGIAPTKSLEDIRRDVLVAQGQHFVTSIRGREKLSTGTVYGVMVHKQPAEESTKGLKPILRNRLVRNR